MAERTLRISARMAEEIRQWASDELGRWPTGTAYVADLESLLAQINAAQPAPVKRSAREQMTLCDDCGKELPHDAAVWTTDGASYCPKCRPQIAAAPVMDQPAPDAVAQIGAVDVHETRFCEHQRGLSVTDERQMLVPDRPGPDAAAERPLPHIRFGVHSRPINPNDDR